jgi:membrane protein
VTSARLFWKKVSNDWVPLFSTMVTYRLLTSAFSILLVILAVGGLILGSISPAAQSELNTRLASSFPIENGNDIVKAVTSRLAQSAGLLLIIGVVAAFYTGSRLFVTLEKAFNIVYRVRGRSALRSNVVAFAMLLLYAVMVPLLLLATLAPPALVAALRSAGAGQVLNGPVAGFLVQALGIVITGVIALVLFGAIYAVVPNRPLRFREVWKGTLVSAVLLILDSLLFPLYVSAFLRPQSRGSIIGLLVVVLAYYFFVAYILLLGAEVNAWAYGLRQPLGSLDGVVQEAQSLSEAGSWHVADAKA